jgi:hypothetical protein
LAILDAKTLARLLRMIIASSCIEKALSKFIGIVLSCHY